MWPHSLAGDLPVSRDPVRAFYLALAEEAAKAKPDAPRTADRAPAVLACACILGLIVAVALLALVIVVAWGW